MNRRDYIGRLTNNDPTLIDFHINTKYFDNNYVKKIVNALKNNTQLESIHFDKGWYFSIEEIKDLANLLKNNKTLKILTLNYCNIRDDGMAELSKTLKVNTTLKILNIRGNHIGIDGIKYLADALKFNTSLVKIDMRPNIMHENFDFFIDEAIEILSDALQYNYTLQKIIGINLGGIISKKKFLTTKSARKN